MNVVTLFVRYGTEKYSHSDEEVRQLFARQMPEISHKLIIVDNSLPRDHPDRAQSEAVVLGGDNRSWEFSAWDRAIDWLGASLFDFDFVNFVTSAFQTLYVKYLDRFSTPMLRAVHGKPVCLGHIDCYNEPVRVLSYASQHWVRTSFFFLPPTEVKALRRLTSLPDNLPGSSCGANDPFPPDLRVSKNYQHYISEWLTGGNIGQGETWHSRINAQQEPFLFQRKAQAILNEHLLSVRLRAQGTRLIDANWLATQMAVHSTDSIDWSRKWNMQLAERDIDRLVLPTPVSARLLS